MRPPALSLPRRFGLSWLVWLVLLLPVSQSFAAWHELSHWGQADGAASNESGLPHKATCELCLAAAAVDHGGLPVAATQLPAPEPATASVAPVPVYAATCAPFVRYLSRAPPASLR